MKKKKTLPMIALLATLGISSLTYTITVSADTATSTEIKSNHIQKNKRGNHFHHASSTNHIKPVAAGIIQSVQGFIVTIQDRNNTTYTVDTSNAVIMKGGRGKASTTIAVADLKVGNMLGAKGTITGTHVLATHVMTGPQHPFMKKIHNLIKKVK